MGPPDPPAGIPSVCCAAGTATITWRSPPYDGGCTVTGYCVEMSRAGENDWTVVAESCHSLSHVVSASGSEAVVAGESYRFRVRAENIHGVSEPGIETDPVRIPREEETILAEDEEEFEPPFEARVVETEDGQLFAERYDVLEELGKGRYGIVRRVIERPTGTSFAAKFVRTIKTKDREQVREEIKIMNMLRHPKLLLLAAAYESPREIVMVTEYISGGELFERVVADDFTLTERDSILFMRQICEGVEYMHQNKVVHLDLKPENIMCRTRTSHQIKLIDFGLAQTLKPDTPIRVLFGTPEFIPPEIISYEPIGTESDMWSVGVICYVLLTGLSPFMGDNDAETFANITRADYDLEDEAFDAISNDAKDFISGLLVKRKELRMSARQCLEHPWMAQHAEAMSRIALPTDKLKKFIVRRKWQKTGNAIRALGRMAILSANSRRSPTATAESSPTSEPASNPIELQSPVDTGQKLLEKQKTVDTEATEDRKSSDFETSFLEEKDSPKKSFEEEKNSIEKSLEEDKNSFEQSFEEEKTSVLEKSIEEDKNSGFERSFGEETISVFEKSFEEQTNSVFEKSLEEQNNPSFETFLVEGTSSTFEKSLEDEKNVESEVSSEGEKNSDIDSPVDKAVDSSFEVETRVKSVYSFCYKTEISIMPQEILETPAKSEGSLSSEAEEASVKSESTMDESRSGSDRNGSEGSQESDISQKTELESDLCAKDTVPSKDLGEEYEASVEWQNERSVSTEEPREMSTADVHGDTDNTESLESVSTAAQDDHEGSLEDAASKPSNAEEEQASGSLETDTKSNSEEDQEEVEAASEIAKQNEESSEKSEQESSARSHGLRRVFRGDSRDSGIGDCSSNLATSSLQLDELGIGSIIEEEDNEHGSAESKETSKSEVSSSSYSRKNSANEASCSFKEEPCEPKRSTKGSSEVATQSGVTKPSCEINRQHEVPGENEDPRILIGRIRSRFVPTGNVSRTAKLFEKEGAASKSSTSVSPVPPGQRAYPAVTVTTGKPHNERIQKAFAFWNK